MEVRFTPELEKRLEDLASRTGVATNQLVLDAVAGYVEELSRVRNTLDHRYDDLKSGRAELIDGAEARARLAAKSRTRRSGGA
jgi:predicted DNA-binding protein